LMFGPSRFVRVCRIGRLHGPRRRNSSAHAAAVWLWRHENSLACRVARAKASKRHNSPK
jgi:hypothetical protein